MLWVVCSVEYVNCFVVCTLPDRDFLQPFYNQWFVVIEQFVEIIFRAWRRHFLKIGIYEVVFLPLRIYFNLKPVYESSLLGKRDRMFSFVRAEKTKKYFKFILYCLSNKSSMFKKLFIKKAEIGRNIWKAKNIFFTSNFTILSKLAWWQFP